MARAPMSMMSAVSFAALTACIPPWQTKKLDRDGDGFPFVVLEGDGYANSIADCDDDDPSIHPYADEIPGDLIDQNCNHFDPGWGDADGDGAVATGGDSLVDVRTNPQFDCDDGDPEVNPGAEERCNGRDDDCDGTPGEDESDFDHDGYVECVLNSSDRLAWPSEPVPTGGGDCEPDNPSVYPGAPPLCRLSSADTDYDCNQTGDVGDVYEGRIAIVPQNVDLATAVDADRGDFGGDYTICVQPGEYVAELNIEQSLRLISYEGSWSTYLVPSSNQSSVPILTLGGVFGERVRVYVEGFTLTPRYPPEVDGTKSEIPYGGALVASIVEGEIRDMQIEYTTSNAGGGIYAEQSDLTLTDVSLYGTGGASHSLYSDWVEGLVASTGPCGPGGTLTDAAIPRSFLPLHAMLDFSEIPDWMLAKHGPGMFDPWDPCVPLLLPIYYWDTVADLNLECEYGGGIYIEGGSVTLDNVEMWDCAATNGGQYIYAGGAATVGVTRDGGLFINNDETTSIDGTDVYTEANTLFTFGVDGAE